MYHLKVRRKGAVQSAVGRSLCFETCPEHLTTRASSLARWDSYRGPQASSGNVAAGQKQNGGQSQLKVNGAMKIPNH